MFARLATFTKLDPDDLDESAVENLRRIIRSTPGYRAGFHLRDSETGKALSFAVYESRGAMQAAGAALAERRGDERVGIDPDSVEFFDEVIEF